MRKRIVGAGIVLFCLLLGACTTPIDFFYDYTELRDNVIRIELIYYDNDQVAEVRENFWGNARHLNFDFDRVEHIEIMSEEHFEQFLSEISTTWGIVSFVQQYNSPHGIAILMHYENGDFDIITEDYVGRFNNDGSFIEYMGKSRNLENLIAYFFETQVE